MAEAVLDDKALDNTSDDPTRRAPLILGGNDFTSLTDTVCAIVERPKPPRVWYVALAFTSSLTALLLAMVVYLIAKGVGVWGLNRPVGWAFDITNFVFWVGIGHAGTLISAILFLFRQKWRTSINRSAEAMTIFAVICAGIFPMIHVGRVWLVYWLAPLPNQMEMWPNFRSPLLWDAFAVGTYMTVSLMFWFMGMVPDLATLRDRATTRSRQIVYGLLSLGWRASNRHWHRYERAYLLLASLATPLVLSVHSVVSFDFAVSMMPGWHATIFPPYFVAGAIFGGFAMVMLLIVPSRAWFGLEEIITLRHLENMAKILLATGSMVGYAYAVEFFIAWYSGNPVERFVFVNRAFGPYAWAYWIMVSCNVLSPQLFWFRKARKIPVVLWTVALLITIGMWFERFVIIVTSLHRDFLPSSWGMYWPSWVELCTFAGTFGLFFTLFLLFVRFLPMVAMAEVKTVMPSLPRETVAGRGPGDYWGDFPRLHDALRGRRRPSWFAGEPKRLRGLLAEFEDPETLRAACERVRDAGFTRWDAHTPFPVHGLNDAMGIRSTRLPWLVLAAGATGAAGGVLLQWWTNAVDYPFLVSGKPFFSLPANVPVAFELTILLAALTAFGGMLVGNRLPRFSHPLLRSERFRRATADRFLISVEISDPKFDPEKTGAFLGSLGATSVESVEG